MPEPADFPTTPPPHHELIVKRLRAANRRVRSVLVANADRLSSPFADAPGINPWDNFVRPAMQQLQRAVNSAAVALAATGRPVTEADDGEGDELVCVDQCGSCDACGMEPFGTPAEGWREAARFLRQTARDSGDRAASLHAAHLIEDELRRRAEDVEEFNYRRDPDAELILNTLPLDAQRSIRTQLAAEARPRCPHCQMPHDLTPGSLPVAMCESVRQRIAKAALLHPEGDHSLCTRSDCDALRDRAPQDGAQPS
ncbi:hypothetical protein [Streptomyces scabiei]|uniref:hypothetical protein n=1 Tax=Streptomyces scabiei TaxID=1930 RepID=UPI0029BEBD24|nr:hypothetical protein [Streptomyces scabiei]MDX3202099.1 hypothetical protein [Streptomyces scabiei]MDX3217712.1 hypothetical protein [Streptomyces scabiei]